MFNAPPDIRAYVGILGRRNQIYRKATPFRGIHYHCANQHLFAHTHGLGSQVRRRIKEVQSGSLPKFEHVALGVKMATLLARVVSCEEGTTQGTAMFHARG